jgi:tetratricopeptide (TPR) repeat protein
MPDDPHLLLFQGQLALNAADFSEADARFKKVTELRADFSSAWDGWGESLDSQDKLTEARAAFATAVRIAPEEPRYRANLAAVELRLREPHRALEVLDKAIAGEAHYWYPRVLRVKAMLLLDDRHEARRAADTLARQMQQADAQEINRNDSTWSFRVPDGVVRLNDISEKRFYVFLLAAAVSFLADDGATLDDWAKEANKHPPAQQHDIRVLTFADLDAAQCLHPQTKQSIEDVQTRLLRLRERPWPLTTICRKPATTG